MAAEKLVDLRLLLGAMSTLGKQGPKIISDLTADLENVLCQNEEAASSNQTPRANRSRLAATLGRMGA